MLSVGQKLWYVPNHGEAREIEVTKVGRKWATTPARRGLRVDVNTLSADDAGYSPGRCYLDREKYETEQARQAEWWNLYRCLSASPPAHMTLEDIREIRAKLQI